AQVGLAGGLFADGARLAAGDVAVGADPGRADGAGRAGHPLAAVDAAQLGIAGEPGRAGVLGALAEDAQVVLADAVGRALELALPAARDALTLAAAHPLGAGGAVVDHAVAVVVLAVADLGGGAGAAATLPA